MKDRRPRHARIRAVDGRVQFGVAASRTGGERALSAKRCYRMESNTARLERAYIVGADVRLAGPPVRRVRWVSLSAGTAFVPCPCGGHFLKLLVNISRL